MRKYGDNYFMNLKKIRKKHGYTQADIAKILQITPQAYAHYEQGYRSPNIETLQILANFYGITIENLINDDCSDNSHKNESPTLVNKNTISIIGRSGGKKDIVLDDEQFQAVKTILENIAKQNEENN